jgi:hypothetical protein
MVLMFAALFFDRDPLRFQDLAAGLGDWVRGVGGFAWFWIVLWLIFGYSTMRAADLKRIPSWQIGVFRFGFFGATLAYAIYGISRLPELYDYLAATGEPAATPLVASPGVLRFRTICLTVGGGLSLVAVGLPFLVNLPSLRWRRVWALAKLSFKEAVRSRVLYFFLFLLLIFLFGSWFISSKPENQLRTYVETVYFSMAVLLVLTASLLAAFGIPADIRTQTIHTIITKPVERFEIVLGRFLGYVGLMTIVLGVMTAVSLLYIVRGIDPDAAEESLKARNPLYGDLHFEGTQSPEHGDNVGLEWEYRSYITRAIKPAPEQYAVWTFPSVPRSLADRKQVRCEITFHIYRTTKGYENKGVLCSFTFLTANFNKDDPRYEERKKELKKSNRPAFEVADQLAEEFGIYEDLGKEVTKAHTQSLELPAGLFKNAFKDNKSVPITVRVKCDQYTQYVGMAKYDLYLRTDDPEGSGDRLWFAFNFFKGSAGIWFLLCLVVGIAVTLSTYLSGVISWLVAMVLLIGGLFTDHIHQVASGVGPANSKIDGPAETFYRLITREVAAAPLQDTTAKKVATGSDDVVRLVLRGVAQIFPDIDRFDLTSYVAEGFNIPWSQIGVGLILLLAYLLPCALLAFYMMKWREVASAT